MTSSKKKGSSKEQPLERSPELLKKQRAVEQHLDPFAAWIAKQKSANRLCYIERPGVASAIAVPDGHLNLCFAPSERAIAKRREEAREAKRTRYEFKVLAWGRFTDLLTYTASAPFLDTKREIAVAMFCEYLSHKRLSMSSGGFGSILFRDDEPQESLDARNELADKFLEKM